MVWRQFHGGCSPNGVARFKVMKHFLGRHPSCWRHHPKFRSNYADSGAIGRSRCKEREMVWRGKLALESVQAGISCHNLFLFGTVRGGEEKCSNRLIPSQSTLCFTSPFLFPCMTPRAACPCFVYPLTNLIFEMHRPRTGSLFTEGVLPMGCTVQGFETFSRTVPFLRVAPSKA